MSHTECAVFQAQHQISYSEQQRKQLMVSHTPVICSQTKHMASSSHGPTAEANGNLTPCFAEDSTL